MKLERRPKVLRWIMYDMSDEIFWICFFMISIMQKTFIISVLIGCSAYSNYIILSANMYIVVKSK